MTTDPKELLAADMSRFHFARLSAQYYVLGRAAALNHQIPVLGNLFHHAVEMALKAALAHQFDLEAMKKKLSHHLPKIWERFLALNPRLDGTEHAGTVERLHCFEELRYPDSMVANNWMIQFALFRYEVGALSSFGKYCNRGTTYLLVLEDIDALIAFIFKSAGLNLEDHLGSRTPEVLELLTKHNQHLPAK